MPEIAIGRKQIMAVLQVDSWRTIQKWKKSDAGFCSILRHHPISGKPFIVKGEAVNWMIEYDKLKKAAAKM